MARRAWDRRSVQKAEVRATSPAWSPCGSRPCKKLPGRVSRRRAVCKWRCSRRSASRLKVPSDDGFRPRRDFFLPVNSFRRIAATDFLIELIASPFRLSLPNSLHCAERPDHRNSIREDAKRDGGPKDVRIKFLIQKRTPMKCARCGISAVARMFSQGTSSAVPSAPRKSRLTGERFVFFA